MNQADTAKLADLCTDLVSLHNALLIHLRAKKLGSREWLELAQEVIGQMLAGSNLETLYLPDGSALTVEEAVKLLDLHSFVESKAVQAVVFGAEVLQLPICEMCGVSAKYRARIWTTGEQCNLCQKHFDEFGVKNAVRQLNRKHQGGFMGEKLDDELTYKDLAEAIYELSKPYRSQHIDPTYLKTKISLLREVFVDSDDLLEPVPRGGRVVDDRFLSGESMPPVDLFGIEGHLEGFPALINAWREMGKRNGQEIASLNQSIDSLRKEWILIYLEEQLSESAKKKTITLSELVDRGLPSQPPPFDPFDNF